MNTANVLRRSLLLAVFAVSIPGAARPALAHDFSKNAIRIDHPYSVPTPPAARTGAVYFRGLQNRGTQPDRLVGATSPVAERIEIHQSTMDGDVARMRELPALELPAGRTVALRHDGSYHLMLVDLKRPLKDGDRFDVTLRFEGSGEVTVPVDVHRPMRSGRDDKGHGHRH